MWSSIFPRCSLLALAAVAACHDSPDIELTVTRESLDTSLSIHMREVASTEAGRDNVVFLAGEGGKSSTVGFYVSGSEPMIMEMWSNALPLPTRCEAYRVPLDAPPSSMTYKLPAGELSCETCVKVPCLSGLPE